MANDIEDTREAIESADEPTTTDPSRGTSPTAASGAVSDLNNTLADLGAGFSIGGGPIAGFDTGGIPPATELLTQRMQAGLGPAVPPPDGGIGPGIPAPGIPEQRDTAGELVTQLFQMNQGQLDDLRKSLYVGGFYGTRAVESIGLGSGTPDDLLLSAYGSLLERTAQFEAAGRPLTVDEVLDRAASEAGLDALVGGGGAQGATVLSDPVWVAQAAKQKAAERGLDPDRVITPEVEQAVTAALHAAQRQSQAGIRAAQTGGGEVTGVEAQSRIAEFIEERFGVQIDRQERVEATRTSQDAFNDAADVISQMVGGV